MRCFAGLLAGVSVALLAGCATQRPSVSTSTPPTVEELPQLAHLERTLPAVITVEQAERTPRWPLVPELKEPELTPEERRLLTLEVPEFKFLPYADQRLRPESPVAPWLGGVTTGANGAAFPETVSDRERRVTGVAGWAGATMEIDPLARGVSQAGPARISPARSGPPAAVLVEADPHDKRIAERKPRIER